MSQENVSDKVRDLQRQIAQSIRFGQKLPSLRKSGDAGGSSDEEEAPGRPLEVLAQVEVEPVATKGAFQTGDLDRVEVETQGTVLKSPRAKRAVPFAGTIESINLDAVPLSLTCLDSTAAKYKLSIKPKNQRVSRKHRRFTQDTEDVSTSSVVQEETDSQTPADDSSGSIVKFKESLWAEDELPIGSPEKSKKPKLQDEARLLGHEWEVEEWQSTKRWRNLDEKQGSEEEELRNKEEEDQRKAEQLRLQKEKMMKEEMERRGKEKTRIKNEEKVKQLQELEAELQHLEEERRLVEEEEKCRLRELEEQSPREQEAQRQEEKRKQRTGETEQYQEEKKRINEVELQRQTKEWKKGAQDRWEKQSAEQSKLCVKVASQLEDMGKNQGSPEDTVDPATWKQKAEELRWREMDERQGQRPFTFKVSSGEKQILFQRVNLSPVSPCRQQGALIDSKETKTLPAGSVDSPTLPSSLFVPHTAILVTGAQLCGAAVNLDQIKDPACKSLLGLTEDKKTIDLPPSKGPTKTSPERKSGKTKSLNESSADQSSAAMLAEWASIRSKIFKKTEDENAMDENSGQQNQPPSEDPNQKSFSGVHGNLRKTMSINAKFSITPARQKFPESSKASEEAQQRERHGEQVESSQDTGLPPPESPVSKAQNRTSKTVRILDRTEGCVFAKDLPSFLVPSPPQSSLRSRSQSEALNPVVSDSSFDGRVICSEDKASPFGVKLRRTNYSLRFRSEQPVEKRKKRYSAGDSFDGIPTPLTPIDPDSDVSAPSDKSSPSSPLHGGIQPGYTGVPAEPKTPAGQVPISVSRNECERFRSRQLPSKPSVAPKPSSATPPPSPQVKSQAVALSTVGDAKAHEQDHSTALHVKAQLEAEGPKERKSFFPSISIPWREKGDRRVEVIKKEKPFLQSRHSLDSERVEKETGPHLPDRERLQEKEAGPLWITLALQKQKGFREQQQSREERRQMREVRLAERQSREEHSGHSSPESKDYSGISSDKSGGGSLPQKTGEEGDKACSALGLFERREHLRKANTLPGSVTVEISDSTAAAPPAKEIAKRFPSVESAQVCTEPAWLALAKRKAKAWSDCPQIIK